MMDKRLGILSGEAGAWTVEMLTRAELQELVLGLLQHEGVLEHSGDEAGRQLVRALLGKLRALL